MSTFSASNRRHPRTGCLPVRKTGSPRRKREGDVVLISGHPSNGEETVRERVRVNQRRGNSIRTQVCSRDAGNWSRAPKRAKKTKLRRGVMVEQGEKKTNESSGRIK